MAHFDKILFLNLLILEQVFGLFLYVAVFFAICASLQREKKNKKVAIFSSW